MKNLLLSFWISLSIFSLQAQVFDNIVNYSAPAAPVWPPNQIQVITPSTGDYYYHLSGIPFNDGAVVTKLDPNGMVIWAQHIRIAGGHPHYYVSFCFNASENEIALVGTVHNSGTDMLLVSTIDAGSGTMLSSMAYTNIDYEAGGVSIQPFGDNYIVAGTLEEFSPANKRMFLAQIDNSLNLTWSYFFKDSNGNSVIYRDMAIANNEATIIGERNQNEIICLHFDLISQTLNYNYGGGQNTVGLLYSQVLESPPHLLIAGDIDADLVVYIGAGLLAQSGLTNILLAQLNYSDFVVLWSNQYIDPSAPNAAVWSRGRLKLEDDLLISSFQSINSSPDDDGIIHVERNTGTWIDGFSYHNWNFATLHEVNSITGSRTLMTGGVGTGNMRFFDGDGFGMTGVGCGYTPRTFNQNLATPSYNLYTYSKHFAFAEMSIQNAPLTVTGSITDCSGAPIGSFKKPLGINEANSMVYSIYPNPVMDLLKIQLNEEVEVIELLDLHGRVIQSIPNPKMSFEMNLTNVPKGFYILRFVNEKSVSSTKIQRL